ncbi:MAG: hypothetical protein LBH40_04380 [Alphaproteobacteria bacterium]|jgi:AGZA family xanthine/uracil permease-like MFS transporter|nr:hypothetical protein [Alphaproteobacteria bacterium]
MQRLFKSADIESSLGIFFDSFIKIMIAITVFSSVLHFTLDDIFKDILPSFGISIVVLQVFLLIYCLYLNKRGNTEAIPLPSGISANRFFVWIFAIMVPTYTATNNLALSLAVGVGANFLSSLLTMILALFSNIILRYIPSAALFATVSGASMAWLILSPIKEAFNTPVIAFVCFFVVLLSYIGNLKIKIPPLLLSVVLGIIIAFATNNNDIVAVKSSLSILGFYLPSFFDNLLIGIKQAYNFLPIILAITIVELIASIQGVEQAKNLNAKYNTQFSIFGVGFVSLLSSFIGNPFTLSVLWGYSTWTKIGASRNYVIYLGILFILLSLSGISFFLMQIIPVASVIPIIVFIGLINIADTIKMHSDKYYLPIIIGMIFPLMDFLKTTTSDLSVSLNFLANGATIISLFWGSIFVFLIDKKYLNVAIMFVICSVLSFVGLIHSNSIQLFADTTFTIIYLVFALIFGVYYLVERFNLKKNI